MSSLCRVSYKNTSTSPQTSPKTPRKKTKPGNTQDNQDKTSDTRFNETPKHHTPFVDHQTPLATPENGETSEINSRTMAEKGFQFRCMLKEKSAKATPKNFHPNGTAFHSFLAGTKDHNQIDRKLKCIKSGTRIKQLARSWIHFLLSELISKLFSSIKDSIQALQTAVFNRASGLHKDETLSVSASMRSKLLTQITTLDVVINFSFVALIKKKSLNHQSECAAWEEKIWYTARLKNNRGF